MRFFSDRGEEITDLDGWERLAGPASKSHWKTGRSAVELARDWLGGGAWARAERVLSRHPGLGSVTLERAIAEKRTRFDDVGRGPRNHDLLVIGSGRPGAIVVGVEGKADESFGETLAQYRDAKRSERSRAGERLERLALTLFGATLDQEPALEGVRYQLCSALAGTLADAKREGAATAVLLVHEFRTDLTADELHEANASDLDTFIGGLPGEPDRDGDPSGWITGPWTIRGDGEWLPAATAAFVAKVVTDLRPISDALSGGAHGGAQAIPAPDADWEEISTYAHLFDGYAHFGDNWAGPFHQPRERWERTGELPDQPDDLRALLFLEFRSDRFAYGDDVTLSGPDEEGVRDIIPNPDYESTLSVWYRRAIVTRLRVLAGAPARGGEER